MNNRNYHTADENVLDQVRYRGGAMTIDYCTDDVQKHVVTVLNRLAAKGKLTKTISANHLIHTWTLPNAVEA